MTSFQYHPDILSTFPDLAAGVVIAGGLRSGDSPDGLRAAYTAEQQAVIARIGDKPLSELPSLAAWRAAFRKFGVDPTQYRSAAEALLRRLTKKGDIPSINTLVDIGNLVSIRYGIPIAVIDRRAITGAITVGFADGSERFVNLGQAEADNPYPGEVVFTDETNMVVARRWCWRQSDESGAKADTTDVLITVEAHHAGGRADVESACRDLTGLLAEYTGGHSTYGILDRDHPAIEG